MSLLLPIAKGFTNIRGTFKFGLVDIGTQSSLIQRSNGKYILLDALTFEPPIKAEVDKLSAGEIEAIINVHPFHTLHCEWAHKAYPNAKLYGTARHLKNLPNLPWEKELVESQELQAKFADDLDFTIPKGVDFISSNESVHFSSVIVLHKATGTCHVDDTFVYVPLPKVAEVLGIKEGAVGLHPALPAALQHRAGACEDFREWLKGVARSWDIKNLCAAHSGVLTASANTGKSIPDRLTDALWLAEPILVAHEAIYGKAAKL